MTEEATAERALSALDQLTASLLDPADDEGSYDDASQETLDEQLNEDPSSYEPSSAKALDTVDFLRTNTDANLNDDVKGMNSSSSGGGVLEGEYHAILDKFLHLKETSASDTFLQLSNLLRSQHQQKLKLNHRSNNGYFLSSTDQEEADTWMLMHYLAHEDDDGIEGKEGDVHDMLLNYTDNDDDMMNGNNSALVASASLDAIPLSISGVSQEEFVSRTLRNSPALNRLCILRKWLEYCHAQHHAHEIITRPLRASKVLSLPDTPMQQHQSDAEVYLKALYHAILSGDWQVVRSICERHGELWRWVTLSGSFPLDYICTTSDDADSAIWNTSGNPNVHLWREQCHTLAVQYHNLATENQNNMLHLEAALYDTLAYTRTKGDRSEVLKANPFFEKLPPYERQHADWLLEVRGAVEGIVDDVLHRYINSTSLPHYETSMPERAKIDIGMHFQLQSVIAKGISSHLLSEIEVDNQIKLRLMTHLVILLNQMAPVLDLNPIMISFVRHYIQTLSEMNAVLVPLYATCLPKADALGTLAEIFHNINDMDRRREVLHHVLRYFSQQEVMYILQKTWDLHYQSDAKIDETVAINGVGISKHAILQMHSLSYASLYQKATGNKIISVVKHTSNLLRKFVANYADGDTSMLHTAQILLQRFDPSVDVEINDDYDDVTAINDKRALTQYIAASFSYMQVKRELVPAMTSSKKMALAASLELYTRKIRSIATRLISEVEQCADELEHILTISFDDLLFTEDDGKTSKNDRIDEERNKLRRHCLPDALQKFYQLLRSSATYLETLCYNLELATTSSSSSQAQDLKQYLHTTIHQWYTRAVRVVSEVLSRDELLSLVKVTYCEDILQMMADDCVKVMQYEKSNI